jgi:hypothetical protein
MSNNTGTAPVISIAATVATAVCATVAMAVPGPMPNALRAKASASVPLAQLTACLAPSHVANSFSKVATSLPRTY